MSLETAIFSVVILSSWLKNRCWYFGAALEDVRKSYYHGSISPLLVDVQEIARFTMLAQ